MSRTGLLLSAAAVLLSVSCARDVSTRDPAPSVTKDCGVFLTILGVAQDAGKPQIGNHNDPAWSDGNLRRLPTSIALVDKRTDDLQRWLFDASPQVTEQLYRLETIAPSGEKLGLDGVFLTHAHIGHYAGLMFFGHEAAGAKNLPVYAMPRMANFITNNGPWSQLVKYNNIALNVMSDQEPNAIAADVAVTPFLVPHRQEFSEVVGFRIEGPGKSAIFLPDIDSWEEWDAAGTRIEDMIASVDVAYLDATFFANGEIPGRDMSGFPHPFVSHSMDRFKNLPEAEKEKIWFIHMNHTNPLLNPDAPERKTVTSAGFNIADEGEHYCLTGD